VKFSIEKSLIFSKNAEARIKKSFLLAKNQQFILIYLQHLSHVMVSAFTVDTNHCPWYQSIPWLFKPMPRNSIDGLFQPFYRGTSGSITGVSLTDKGRFRLPFVWFEPLLFPRKFMT
jgi:hypothetical protein